MNKKEYLNELGKRLKGLPAEDREDALRYYEELIGDMGYSDDDDVSLRLGQPREAARNIFQDTTSKYVDRAAGEAKGPKKARNTATVIWLTILGILSAPISLPLVAVAFAMAVVLFALVIALIVTLFAVSLSCIVAGFCSVVGAFVLPGFISKTAWFGVGLGSLGAGLLIGIGTVAVLRLIIKGLGKKNKKKEVCINE